MTGAAASSAPDTALLSVRNVTKKFGDFVAVDDVSFDLRRGEVLSVVGSSGSGKSTLLRCINHLEQISSGEIWLEDDLIGYSVQNETMVELSDSKCSFQRRRLGMVFQNFQLFPHMTALENVIEAPRRVQRRSRRAATARARELLASVGLEEHADRYPAQLSGGQQQRVAIARALCMEPQIMLFDEPTSALDPELVGEVLAVMRRLAEAGTTMIVVTHEMAFARDVSHSIAVMHDGRIVDYGEPEHIVRHSTNSRSTALFAGLQREPAWRSP